MDCILDNNTVSMLNFLNIIVLCCCKRPLFLEDTCSGIEGYNVMMSAGT